MKKQLLTTLIATTILLSSITSIEGSNDLPPELTALLNKPSTMMAIHIQWMATRQLPLTERFLKFQKEYGYFGPVSSVFAAVTSTTDLLPLEIDDMSEVWLVSKNAHVFDGLGLWVYTTRDAEQLREILLNEGWVELEDESLGLPPPPELLIEFEARFNEMRNELSNNGEDMDEYMAEYYAEHRASLMAPKAVIKLADDGWLCVSRDRGPYGHHENDENENDGIANSTDKELQFPMSSLLDLPKSTLLAIAINIPKNDEAPEVNDQVVDPQEHAIREIRRRIDELEGHSNPFRGDHLADFAVTVHELDGAIAIDIIARRPGGGYESETAEMLEMILLGARIAAGTDRELARQLSYATVTAGTGEVRAECILNQTTLINTLEERMNRQSELRELYERLHELMNAESEE